MDRDETMIGVLLEERALSIDELARACHCEPGWIVDHIESGVLECTVVATGERRFTSAAMVRARRLLSIERTFEADAELAALAVDLIEEVEALRRQLNAARRSKR